MRYIWVFSLLLTDVDTQLLQHHLLKETEQTCPSSIEFLSMLKISWPLAGRQWLMPVILATWEVEIRKIRVRGQLRKIFGEIPSPK
jgi:hypothetical protein